MGAVARALAGLARPTLFAPKAALHQLGLADLANLNEVELQDFDTKTSADGLRDNDPEVTQWHIRLPDLECYDLVISDNLPEVLHRRPDALLSGGFFWHEAVPDAHREYIEKTRALITRHNPIMITSGLFAPAYLHEQTRLLEVGLYRLNPPVEGGTRRGRPRDGLLIACGRGGEVEDITAAAIVELATGELLQNFKKVLVEPHLLPDNPPGWMLAADFSAGMYAGLRAAVIRPGIGTLSECLLAHVPVCAFYEQANQEMTFNAAQLESIGAGWDCRDIAAALARARNLPQLKPADYPDDGVAATADLLLQAAAGKLPGFIPGLGYTPG